MATGHNMFPPEWRGYPISFCCGEMGEGWAGSWAAEGASWEGGASWGEADQADRMIWEQAHFQKLPQVLQKSKTKVISHTRRYVNIPLWTDNTLRSRQHVPKVLPFSQTQQKERELPNIGSNDYPGIAPSGENMV